MLNQTSARQVARDGLFKEWAPNKTRDFKFPIVLDIQRKGFTIESWIKFDNLAKDSVLFDTTDRGGAGICVSTRAGRVNISMSDGSLTSGIQSDDCKFQVGQWNHIICIIDPGPRIVLCIINGRLSDGGKENAFGWMRYSKNLNSIGNSPNLDIKWRVMGELGLMRIYERPLSVSEAISNFRAGRNMATK